MSYAGLNIGQRLVGAQAGLAGAMQGGQDIAWVGHDVMAAENQQNLQQ